MSAPTKEHKARVTILARKIRPLVDGVTHSREVSKEFYLVSKKIQKETKTEQMKIIYTACDYIIKDFFAGKVTEKGAFDKLTNYLLEAYEDVKNE